MCASHGEGKATPARRQPLVGRLWGLGGSSARAQPSGATIGEAVIPEDEASTRMEKLLFQQ